MQTIQRCSFNYSPILSAGTLNKMGSDLKEDIHSTDSLMINSLLNMAAIIFKNARDETPSELKAKKLLLKSKFKKA
jgi:hypothetical protein